jgi:serine protease
MVEPLIGIWLLAGSAIAAPYRAPPARPQVIRRSPGHRGDLLWVKLVEDHGLVFDGKQITGPGQHRSLNGLLAGARPLFGRPAEVLRADSKTYDPEGTLADLTLWLQVAHPEAAVLGTALLLDPMVESVELAPLPLPPPVDIAPVTPDFTDLQGYLGPAPDGFGVDIAGRWPGGRGGNVAFADVEYGYEPEHEDLEAALGATEVGHFLGWYPSHGNGVLGEVLAGDNGYGVVGMAPGVELVMSSPFVGPSEGDYNVAAAIDDVAAVLDEGDVLLIEQQAWAFDNYAPVEISSAVFDAISMAVAKGIVVVEPTGNGGQDLDHWRWDGWFDRTLRDSGAIMVGGGASPLSGLIPRSWYPGGSAYGDRVDVQGWYDSISSTYTDEYGPSGADLFFPGSDSNQAYISYFGGTSGASPQVASVAIIANSVAWELWGQPWDPMDLRAAMVRTGTPQPPADLERIGPQPDLRQLLRTWGVR